MRQILEFISDKLQDHWIKVMLAVGFALAGWVIGQWRARRAWQRKEFLGRLNISLNMLVDGRLLIRTLAEKSCEEVFLNELAVRTVLDASRRTTAANPMLPLPDEDYWYYLNAVLNEISEQFAQGSVKRDLGQPVVCGRYVVALTSEADGAAKTRKVRAMAIREDVLKNLPEKPPEFESPRHNTRWQTLRFMAKTYAEQPQRFLMLEICV